MSIDVPKIEIVLSDTEYLFLYGVLGDTLQSLDSFAPPPAVDDSLLVPRIPTPVPQSQSPTPQSPVPASPSPSPPPIPSTKTTLQVKIEVHSAILALQLNAQPLAEFSINSVRLEFHNGGKEGDTDLVSKLNVEVANFLLMDKRKDKASPFYKYIVAPKDLDLTMLRLCRCEYLYVNYMVVFL